MITSHSSFNYKEKLFSNGNSFEEGVMMDFLTAKEVAEKWNITKRLVLKYCADGRIEGAQKFGNLWRIPADAAKPDDPRKAKSVSFISKLKQKPNSHTYLMPLMNTPFEVGQCMKIIENTEDTDKKGIMLAEYYYFSGQPEKAILATEPYLNAEDTDIRLSAYLIFTYANLSVGQITRAKHALLELKNALSNAEDFPEVRAAQAFTAVTSAVLLHLPLSENVPSIQDYLYLLPNGIRLFALYVQAHYTYLQEDYGRSLGIAETALALQPQIYPIPTIYLHLVAVMNYMSLKKPDKAKEHLLAAWEIARPDDLIEGFGEHHGLLGGMLESIIKPEYPEDFKRIIAITYRFSAGWRRIHNPATGHDVADTLTTTEFAIAMLAARGWTNQEIGNHLNISHNTVKRHISTVLQKLNIEQRHELKKYMLK